MVNILETYDLSKNYGKHKVIDTVNMHVPHGSIYGFVGENGAGKTTIMRLITGLAMPTSGTYALNGKTNKSKDIYQEKKKMSAIVETTSLVPTMNALDNLKFAMKYLGINDEELPHKLLKTVGLDNVGNKKVKNFSLGMKQRLGIALSLIGEPNFMLLDEPMNGLDPEGIVELRNLIIKLNQEKGITFIISSHVLS